MDKFTYDDGDETKGEDTFAREPFCIKVESNGIAGKKLNLFFKPIQRSLYKSAIIMKDNVISNKN